MKTKAARKVVLMCSVVLMGVIVCMFAWFFLSEHKKSNLIFPNNGITSDSKPLLEPVRHPDENQEDILTLEERIVQSVKNNTKAMLDEQTTQMQQKHLEIINSPAYLEFTKEAIKRGSATYRERFDFFDSQGGR